MDAYWVLVLVQHEQNIKQAYSTCLEVLNLLGEEIPASIELDDIFSRVYSLQQELARHSDSELLNMKIMEDKFDLARMQFYCQIHYQAYFVRPGSGTMVSCVSMSIFC